jgi:hypothetical protein
MVGRSLTPARTPMTITDPVRAFMRCWRFAFPVALTLVVASCQAPAEPPVPTSGYPTAPAATGAPAAPAVQGEVAEADPSRDVPIADPTPATTLGEDAAYPCGAMITRAAIARSIREREPVGTQGPFEANGEPVHVFLELNNPNTEARMTVRWFHDGSQHQFGQDITAGVSPSWRTWVRHRILPEQTGTWRVDVFAPGECLAARLRFDAI